ncbi:MAG: orotidine-5'-phosphate decarboxylase [Nitrospirae bacterium]|nr:orotidine-5'-phosphate decarboxylase [Nitrospirota bacterium]
MLDEKIKQRLCLALDVNTLSEAVRFVETLKDYVGLFKIGFQLFTNEGPKAVEAIKRLGGRVFLDLKFHDIPNTVAAAARMVTALGVDMFNIHASGGSEMMRAAVVAAQEETIRLGIVNPKVLAVTVLTSINDEILSKELIVSNPVRDQVVHLAMLSKEAGVSGVVASPKEIRLIRESCGAGFVILTPGIRPLWSANLDDQKRITTPQDAIALGADYIVIGRPILRSDNPVETSKQILSEIDAAQT